MMNSALLLSKNKEKTGRHKTGKLVLLSYYSGIAWKIARLIILSGLCYIIIYPFLIKIMNSFKPLEDFLDPTVRFIPKSFSFENIQNVIDKIFYYEALKNTTIWSLILACFQTIIPALVGYGFARFKFKGNSLLFGLVIVTLIVPPETILIPLYLKFRFFFGFINLVETPLPMLILSLTAMGLKNGLYIFMFRQFFKNMPKELEEAAYIDGCGAFRTYFKVMIPSAVSLIVTVFLLSFSWQWTDSVFTSLFLQGSPMLSNVIALAGQGEYPIISANYTNIAALLSVLPLALVYVFAQKFFVQSVDRTGLVG